jgi:hypothetical protein
LKQIEGLAARLRRQAEALDYAVASCLRNETTEGLDEMVAMSFNAQQHTPSYGGGGGLPAGPNGEPVRYKVMIVDSHGENTKDNFGNVKGGYLALELASIEGPTQGTRQTDRLNLHHTNPKVVEIANKQLSAYCHVLGRFQFNDTAELHNIPFIVEIGLQKAPNENGYTEVKGIFDINGNEPGKAGGGAGGPPAGAAPPPPAGQPPAGGVAPAGNGWGGPPPGAGPGAPAANSQPPAHGGGWGGPPAGGPPAGAPGGAPPAGGGWGGPPAGGPPAGAPSAGGAGWGGPPAGGPPAGGAGWGAPS